MVYKFRRAHSARLPTCSELLPTMKHFEKKQNRRERRGGNLTPGPKGNQVAWLDEWIVPKNSESKKSDTSIRTSQKIERYVAKIGSSHIHNLSKIVYFWYCFLSILDVLSMICTIKHIHFSWLPNRTSQEKVGQVKKDKSRYRLDSSKNMIKTCTGY